MQIHFHALPNAEVDAARQAGQDAFGNPIEHHVSDGNAYPCRHCLGSIPYGEPYLVLAHRPFETTNPYPETGPIFLCTDCSQAPPSPQIPAILKSLSYILRGYTADERILYGTGGVVPTDQLATQAKRLFENPQIAFADVRSAANNCYQCRIKRA